MATTDTKKTDAKASSGGTDVPDKAGNVPGDLAPAGKHAPRFSGDQADDDLVADKAALSTATQVDVVDRLHYEVVRKRLGGGSESRTFRITKPRYIKDPVTGVDTYVHASPEAPAYIDVPDGDKVDEHLHPVDEEGATEKKKWRKKKQDEAQKAAEHVRLGLPAQLAQAPTPKDEPFDASAPKETHGKQQAHPMSAAQAHGKSTTTSTTGRPSDKEPT